VSDDLHDLEERALEELVGQLVAERRLAQWQPGEPMPPVDELYRASLLMKRPGGDR
jgi:hypothetical protein